MTRGGVSQVRAPLTKVTERTNLVQSRRFREALEEALLRYTNKAISTAEMITRLIDLAKSLREAQRHGEELGLSAEEAAFYDALADNESAREAMQSDTLRLMARELTEMVRKMPKLDCVSAHLKPRKSGLPSTTVSLKLT